MRSAVENISKRK